MGKPVLGPVTQLAGEGLRSSRSEELLSQPLLQALPGSRLVLLPRKQSNTPKTNPLTAPLGTGMEISTPGTARAHPALR